MNLEYNLWNGISRDQSLSIKALAIILIMLGHNHILAPIDGKLFTYLYSFHVAIFFVLPFFYSRHKFDCRYISVAAVRLLVPYFFFCLFCWIVTGIVTGSYITGFHQLKGLINLGGIGTKGATGFYFPWFLLAFFTMTVIRVMSDINKVVWCLALLIGGVLFVITFQNKLILDFVPFYSGFAFAYFFIGTLSSSIYYKNSHFKFLFIIAFVFFSLLYWCDIMRMPPVFLSGVCGFFFFWYICEKIPRNRFTNFVGKNSIKYYLYHVFVYNIFLYMGSTLFLGILNLLLTFLVTTVLVLLTNRLSVFNSVVFPQYNGRRYSE